MLDLHELVNSINRLCEFLDYEYSINNGGCCYVASILAINLERLKIPYSLVVYDSCGKDFASINREVSTKIKNRQSSRSVTGLWTCNHYCLYIPGIGEINSMEDFGYNRYIIRPVSSSNIKWIYKTGSWNDHYDPSDNKTVRSIIKAFFSKYEKVFYCES